MLVPLIPYSIAILDQVWSGSACEPFPYASSFTEIGANIIKVKGCRELSVGVYGCDVLMDLVYMPDFC